MESLEALIVLPIGRAEEVPTGGSIADCLCQHVAVLQSRKIKVTKRVLPERHCPCHRLPFLPVEVFQLRPQMDRGPCHYHELVFNADPLDLSPNGPPGRVD